MPADAVQALFSSKAAKGTNLKTQLSYKVYFAPGGPLTIVMNHPSTRAGSWHVRDDDSHCGIVGSGDERCGRVRDNGDATYTKVVISASQEIPIVMLRDFKDRNQLER